MSNSSPTLKASTASRKLMQTNWHDLNDAANPRGVIYKGKSVGSLERKESRLEAYSALEKSLESC